MAFDAKSNNCSSWLLECKETLDYAFTRASCKRRDNNKEQQHPLRSIGTVAEGSCSYSSPEMLSLI